jgi:hypothetical protein
VTTSWAAEATLTECVYVLGMEILFGLASDVEMLNLLWQPSAMHGSHLLWLTAPR